MVNKNWQRTQWLLAHVGLACGAGIPFFFFETQLAWSIKLTWIVFCYVLLVPLFRFLHKKYANTFVKVFVCDYEQAARIVQRVLNAQRMPFTKKTESEQIVFQIRSGKMRLVVDEFMLNLMFDDHLSDQVAAKLTLQPETQENAKTMQNLRLSLDEAFAIQGF